MMIQIFILILLHHFQILELEIIKFLKLLDLTYIYLKNFFFYKTKLIVGKIIPATITTASMLVGLNGLEFYKFI